MNKEHPNPKTQIFYPLHQKAIELVKEFNYEGNFSLWYNKCIPFHDHPLDKKQGNQISNLKLCNPAFTKKSEDKERKAIAQYFIEYYKQTANNFFKTEGLKNLLYEKHALQSLFLVDAKKKGLETLEIWAKTESRFITGIGNPHPSEISISLDHNLGVPYIPASTLKGVLRFSNALELSKKIDKDKFNDVQDEKTRKLFGSSPEDFEQKKLGNKGSINFLDAYPIPPICVGKDITNPHYSEYYNPSKNDSWPSDNLDPNPIKFLVIEPETVFVFRCICPKGLSCYIDGIFTTALAQGIGAKTSLGYGKFKKVDSSCSKTKDAKDKILSIQNSILDCTKKENDKQNNNTEDSIFKQIDTLQKDRSKIGQLVKNILENNYPLHVYERLKEKLIELNEWEPEKGDAFQKMSEKKKKIQEKIEKLQRGLDYE